MTLNTYWNGNGRYQDKVKMLEILIPAEGAVESPRGRNKALEKFRKACGCYYDLYNNGLINRAGQFRQVFGFSASQLGHRYGRPLNPVLRVEVEEHLDHIVEAAYREQYIA